MIMAVRLETRYSKKEILALYASQAPFGNNVVGLDAASWRYFGKNSQQLSWGEAATLAVLPNSPSLVHLGKNRDALRKKRDRLLDKLFKGGEMDSVTCMLAKAELLPDKPLPLPRLAPHLLARTLKKNFMKGDGKLTLTRSTLKKDLQVSVSNIVARHHEELRGNGVNNVAALVVDVETGDVLAYVGNIYKPGQPEYDSDVDIITAKRSPGSILKPFLYSAMLSDGEILPNTLVPDIPTQIAGYSPENFHRDYDGAVPAKRALERSLNIPAVRMLRSYSYEKFNFTLKKIGMTTLNQPADHYGLSIILGGAEITMWDVAGMYASMARTLNHNPEYSGRYDKQDFHPLNYFYKDDRKKPKPVLSSLDETGLLTASSIWCTFNAMEEVSRPDKESNWQQFSSSQRIAWKTGTSIGFRDGWAIGCTPKYVVAVWVGNADGEGRPGLTGIATAAPVMFDIFKLLKNSSWFTQPFDDMTEISICKKSGHRASVICDDTDTVWVPLAGLKTSPCPYHQLVHLDASGKWRVGSDCESPSAMVHQSWFVLPPAEEWFYKSKNPQYRTLPPFRKDCMAMNKSSVMQFIYPKMSTQIYVPVELDGKTGKAVFEVAHRQHNEVIYWHLDNDYIGSTKDFHQMALNPPAGKHLITLVDGQGEQLQQQFEILEK
jgi:penicillin-binding protein 1C